MSVRQCCDIDRKISDSVIIVVPSDVRYHARKHVSCVHCLPGTNPIHSNIYTNAHNRPMCSPFHKQPRRAI